MSTLDTALDKRLVTSNFVKALREEIIQAFEALEDGETFKRTSWNYKHTGGGQIGQLRGKIFEKAAVNVSEISGPNFPMNDGEGPFYATGISLITHMANPHAPTVHMNLRYLETEKSFWFGGGYDLTPMGFAYDEDTAHFHGVAKATLDEHGEHLYPQFSEAARNYFYIPHRNKERGVGGIFFDHYNTGDFEKDLHLWKDIGKTFLQSILPIYQKRVNQPYEGDDKQRQLIFRSHYVEFNLLYDRGTKFGFQSGGNPEAILCSMPPLAKW